MAEQAMLTVYQGLVKEDYCLSKGLFTCQRKHFCKPFGQQAARTPPTRHPGSETHMPVLIDV